MWIFTRHGMISIVEEQPLSMRVGPKQPKAHKPRPTLVVRARERRPLQQLFPGHRIVANAGTDYQFRCIVLREAAARILAREIDGIDYGNFKSSIADNGYHNVLMRVWSVVANFYRPAKPTRRGPASRNDDPFSLF
jgi:hypothetical protein